MIHPSLLRPAGSNNLFLYIDLPILQAHLSAKKIRFSRPFSMTDGFSASQRKKGSSSN